MSAATPKPLSPEEKSLREAARHIGLDLYATDRFVAAAVVWLLEHGKVTLEPLEGGYSVTTARSSCADERLDWALAGAIHGQAAAGEDLP